jgi:hypothetical protein
MLLNDSFSFFSLLPVIHHGESAFKVKDFNDDQETLAQ